VPPKVARSSRLILTPAGSFDTSVTERSRARSIFSRRRNFSGVWAMK